MARLSVFAIASCMVGCGYDCLPTDDERTQFAIDDVASQGWDVASDAYSVSYFKTTEELYAQGCWPGAGACTDLVDKRISILRDRRPWAAVTYMAHELGHIYFLQKYRNADAGHEHAWWFDRDDGDEVANVDSSVVKHARAATVLACMGGVL